MWGSGLFPIVGDDPDVDGVPSPRAVWGRAASVSFVGDDDDGALSSQLSAADWGGVKAEVE